MCFLVENAVVELQKLNILDHDEHLTTLGRRVAHFTTHPRLSKCLVYATIHRYVSFYRNCYYILYFIFYRIVTEQLGW